MSAIAFQEIDQRNAYALSKYSQVKDGDCYILDYILETIDQASEALYYHGLSDAYISLALYNMVHNPQDNPVIYLDKSAHLIQNHQLNKTALLSLYRAYVVYYVDVQADMKNALVYSNRVSELAEEMNDNDLIMRNKSNMAVINLHLGNLDAAEELLDTCIAYHESINNPSLLMYEYNNIAELYLMQDRTEDSMNLYLKAYELAVINNNPGIRQDVACGLSALYRKSGDFQASRQLVDENIDFVMASQNDRYIVELYIEKSRLLLDMKSYDEAKALLESMEERIIKLQNDATLIHYYEIKVLVHEALEEYKEAFLSKKKEDEIKARMDLDASRKVEHDRIRKEYKRTIERLETIAEIGRYVASLEDIDELLSEVKGLLSTLMNIDNIGIGETSDGQLIFTHYFAGDTKTEPVTLSLKNPTSLATWCINNDTEINIGNLGKESRLYVKNVMRVSVKETNPNNKVMSVMYTPLRVRNEIIGVFTIQSFEENVYHSEEFEIFKIISTYVSIAFKNILQARDLEALTILDSLTKINNRKGFIDGYNYFRHTYPDATLALLMMDLDYFKTINDTYGHFTGDQVLIEIGKILKSKESDRIIPGRLGGEEFGLIICMTNLSEAHTIAREILISISEVSVDYEGQAIQVTTSIGLAVTNNLGKRAYRDLYKRADQALYDAKAHGRNCIVEYSEKSKDQN